LLKGSAAFTMPTSRRIINAAICVTAGARHRLGSVGPRGGAGDSSGDGQLISISSS
jgi:hypothetical protein